jgi:ABC-type multidrug transport system ATPase subunit
MTADREIVASTHGLTKQFGTTIAVRNLDLELRAGEVYGFLGPNGAGKTTTIKLMLGLIRPTGGEVRLFGEPLGQNLPALMKRVGAIIEAPAFYPYLSGRENLLALALIGNVSRERVDETLAIVDLRSAADHAFKTYSLGMKQRLGIAATLLRNPSLIFLDEPTSGLDPAGQIEMRQLIPRLAQEGRTVFISSHQMYDVQQMCDRVAILKRGELIAEGPVAQLLRRENAIELRVPDAAAASQALQGIEWIQSVEYQDSLLTVVTELERASDINRALAEAGIFASEIRPRVQSLEEFFVDVTAEGDRW